MAYDDMEGGEYVLSFQCDIGAGTLPTPATLFSTNLTAWYSADTGVYKDNGVTLCANNDTVQQWNDQSGNGNNLTQATSAARPTFKTASAYNSRSGILFTAASVNYMDTGNSLTIPSSSSVLAGFVVTQMNTGTGSYGRNLSWITVAANVDFSSLANSALLIRNASANAFITYMNNTALESQSISLSTNYRLGAVYDGTKVKTYQATGTNQLGSGGSAGTSVTPTFNSTGALRVGADWNAGSGSTFWDGPILEIVLIKVAPTITQINQLDAYFVNKWGS